MNKFIPLLLTSWLFGYQIAFAQPQIEGQLPAQFDKLLAKQFKPDSSGGAILVTHKGQVIYQKAFGMANIELGVPMKLDHVFRIGSLTKQFTAIAILQLMEQGKLSLQDEITRFLPDYPTQGKKITIEHLLSHTSGIKSYTDMKEFDAMTKNDMTPMALIDFFKDQPMEFEPGTQFKYDNSGYFLLGYIIEKASGKTYPKYLDEMIFRPLGMTNSYYGDNTKLIKNRVAGYEQGKDGVDNADYMSMSQPYAAGAILSTVGDFWKWHQGVHSYKLVKKETLDKAFANHRLSNGKLTGYGYGWGFGNIQGSPTIEHSGGINGFVAKGLYLPQEDIFVTVFLNNTNKNPDVVPSIMAALILGKPYPSQEIAVDVSSLSDYTGVYENSEGVQRIISVVDQQLCWQRPDSPRLKLKAFQRDKFFFGDLFGILYLEFIRNDSGQVKQLRFQGRDASELWQKTNKPAPSTR